MGPCHRGCDGNCFEWLWAPRRWRCREKALDKEKPEGLEKCGEGNKERKMVRRQKEDSGCNLRSLTQALQS